MAVELPSSLSDTFQHAESGRHKLVLVVGESRSGKTRFLRAAAESRSMQYLSLGIQLGSALLSVAPRRRPLAIESFVQESILPNSTGVCIDNTDVLFVPSLRCDPLRLAYGISQNTFVIYSLTGRLDGKRFVRGHPDHPEYFSEELPSVPVIFFERGTPTTYTF